jgi:hypothetical protein
MVNILKEGWKEVKSGTCYEVVMGSGRDVLTGDPIDLARSAACSYVAHLGEPPEFGQKLWAEAVHRRIPPAFDKVCVSDAAHWIWNLCQDYFPEAVQVVDWFHAVEHLHTAANLIHGEGTDQAKRWVKNIKTDLYQGHAQRIANELVQHAHQLSGDRANKLLSEATFSTRCTTLNSGNKVGPWAAALSKVAASNSRLVSNALECVGAVRVPNVCSPFAPP